MEPAGPVGPVAPAVPATLAVGAAVPGAVVATVLAAEGVVLASLSIRLLAVAWLPSATVLRLSPKTKAWVINMMPMKNSPPPPAAQGSHQG